MRYITHDADCRAHFEDCGCGCLEGIPVPDGYIALMNRRAEIPDEEERFESANALEQKEQDPDVW